MENPFETRKSEIVICAGWGKEGSTIALMDRKPEAMDNDGDGKKLADWLWNSVPGKTLDQALDELKRLEAEANVLMEEALAR